MGMYTELHFNVELKENIPSDITKILEHMISNRKVLPDIPIHPLFNSGRWRLMFNSDSYYFSADTHSTIRYDNCAERIYLCIRCNLKNYDNEIEKFIDWIMPFVEAIKGDFLGFSRYESTETPTLIFKT